MANAPRFMSGLGGFFGGGNQDGNQPGGDGRHPLGGDQNDPPMDQYVEEEKEPGVGDILGEMWTPPDEEDEPEPQPEPRQILGPDGKPLPTPQQKLAATIQETIAKMGTPELPADFDPTNPKHLTDFIAKSNQATALATLQMSFQPMQMAMEEMMTNFNNKLDEKLSGFGNQQSESTILKEVVPEIEDPQYSGLVQTLFTQAKKSKAGNGNPKAAAQMVRKGLDAMGIKATRPADPFSGGFKSGKDALDAYAPLPNRPTPQRRQS
jgi:hypothetical protein